MPISSELNQYISHIATLTSKPVTNSGIVLPKYQSEKLPQDDYPEWSEANSGILHSVLQMYWAIRGWLSEGLPTLGNNTSFCHFHNTRWLFLRNVCESRDLIQVALRIFSLLQHISLRISMGSLLISVGTTFIPQVFYSSHDPPLCSGNNP